MHEDHTGIPSYLMGHRPSPPSALSSTELCRRRSAGIPAHVAFMMDAEAGARASAALASRHPKALRASGFTPDACLRAHTYG
ncbi:MAG TPA: hypothetical protein VGE59_01560 [Patescibacteria group bacterium]